MKKLTLVLAICALSTMFIGFAYAQTATQTFNLQVDPIYKISASGNPGLMKITTAVPGSDPTPVTDATTTYSFTHNNKANGAKITASGSVALASGYVLKVSLDGNTAVDISSTSAQDAVTSIAAGAYTGKSISYTFSATAAAGPLSSTGETVTFTVVGL
jgi:hypothetical protein